MYQALYRKWRPRTFDDVVGQEHITETLKAQVREGRLSHAYLFIGTRGTGKTTCAKILAKAVNCEHPVNGNPCNQCAACRGIDEGSLMDVVEMDAASNNGVDSVRALRDEAIFSPANAKMRVYIIDEVHMLSASAFNALLKILEEPPSHLMFILATTELQKVLPTILSRCQRHSFKRLDTESIINRLRYVAGEESMKLSPDAAALIASLSEGGMRDALSMLDQCSGRGVIDTDTVYSAMGLAGQLRICEMLDHISRGDTAAAIELFRELWQGGKDPSSLLGELSGLMREVLMRSVAPKGGRELLTGCYEEKTLASFGKRFSTGQLVNSISLIQTALADMRQGQARTICELCLIRLCEPALGADLPLLQERVQRLERSLAELMTRPVQYSPAPAAAAEPETEYMPEPEHMSEAEEEYVPEPESEYVPEPEPEYVPDFGEDAVFGFNDLADILPPAPAPAAEDEPASRAEPIPGLPADPRDALLFVAASQPQQPETELEEPDDLPFDLDVPSFMKEPERERPPVPEEKRRKLYFTDDVPAPSPSAPAFSVPDAPAAPAGDIWETVKASLPARLPMGLYMLLTDSTQVSAQLEGSELILSIKDSFAMNMLDRPDVISKLSAAATEAAGRPIAARVVDAASAPASSAAIPQDKVQKLDELGKFKVVTFK